VAVARARVAVVVALCASMTLVASGSAATGQDRVLAVLATSGPMPYSAAEFKQVTADVGAFFQSASFGRVRFSFEVTPWLDAFQTARPSCGGFSDRSMDGAVAPARDAARLAGYDPDQYDQVLYALGDVHCGFYGITWGRQVMLTRAPSVDLLVHELGHTLGLGHALAAKCAVGCGSLDPGDPYTPMGTGGRDFSAYEKSLLGWIGAQPHATVSGNYTIVPPTKKTKLAQALVVDTPEGQWWLEFRAKPFRGVLVRFVEAAQSESAFAPSATLILRPTGTKRDWIVAGETFRAPGLFTVRLVRASATAATLRLKLLAVRR
jgi:hypothetical protein